MTALPTPSLLVSLPESVRRPLRAVVRRQWVVAAACGLLRAITLALLILLACALLLGCLSSSRGLRFSLAALAWAAILHTAARSLRPLLSRWTLSRAARQVEKTLPHLEERLSSAVELLIEEKNPAFRGSPQLLAHLAHQAESEAAAIHPSSIVPADPVVRWGVALGLLLISIAILAVNGLTGPAVARGAYGAFFPWAAHLPASLARVRVSPGDITLPGGDPLEISASVASRPASAPAPTSASLVRRFDDGQMLSQSMEASSSGAFRVALESVQQGFAYRVRTDGGDSDWYTVTVHPRPVLTRMDVHYDYPAYSGLSPRDEESSEGAIQGLIGTRVTLILHCAEPIVVEKSRLAMDARDAGDAGQAHEQLIPLAEANPRAYRAAFTIERSGTYGVRLVNSFGLANREELPRTITALVDAAPSVAILAPSAQVRVRPDDVVPVDYLAADDFAIASLSAIVQLDDGPERTIPLPLPAGDRRSFGGTWPIDIQKMLADFGSTAAARISYQLKVLDNRDPDSQSGVSAKQVLLLDAKQSRSYVAQVNEQRRRALQDAIRKALDRVKQADWRSNNLANFDEKHVLNPDERRDARELRDLLAGASRDLASAAEEFSGSAFAGVALQAKQIAEHPIADAADHVAQAEFSADAPPERRRNASQARLDIANAIKRLEALHPAAEAAQRRAESLEALNQAARKQRQAADEMLRHPENREPNRRVQQQAIDRLNDAMGKDESLRNDPARELARQLSELTDQIEQDRDRQAKLRETLSAGKNNADAVSQQQRDLANQTGALRQAAQHLAERSREQKSASVARRAQGAQELLEKAAAAQQNAADAASRHDRERADEQQNQAHDALTRADDALRGNPQASAADAPGDGGKDAQASSPQQAGEQTGKQPSKQHGEQAGEQVGEQTGKQPGASEGSPSSAGAKKATDGADARSGSSPQEAAREAAQAAQEAAAAQRQAMRPNPAAARQAADALARAASAAARAQPGQADSGKSPPGTRTPSDGSADAGAPSPDAPSPDAMDSASTPGKSADSRSGIRGQGFGGSNARPAAVRDLGISAGDWARLPPLVQRDLVNAARQAGPPAYREMIRDYYARIARLQSDRREER